MADRTFTMAESSEAFRAAAHWWRSLVGGIEDHQWALMALGEWNVTELVAHTSRAFTTVVDYARGSVKDPTPIASAAEYFRIVLAEETPHLHIAARARTEASAHTDWVQATDDRWAAAAQVIDNTPGDGLVGGIGDVDGRPTVVASYDYTVLAGTQGAVGHLKKDRLFELIEKIYLPDFAQLRGYVERKLGTVGGQPFALGTTGRMAHAGPAPESDCPRRDLGRHHESAAL